MFSNTMLRSDVWSEFTLHLFFLGATMDSFYIVLIFSAIIILLVMLGMISHLGTTLCDIEKHMRKHNCKKDKQKGGLCWNCIYGYNQLFYKHEDEYYPDKKTCKNVDCDMFCRDISPDMGCVKGYIDAEKNMHQH